MLTIEWNQESGWMKPTIKPYGPLSLQPSCTVFHYGIECFEGMKAYKDKNGTIRLFRPDKNMERMSNSAQRLLLPDFDKSEFLNCIKELIKYESSWIPSERGYSLYIRPTMIGTQESLGVGPSSKALLYVICCPVGPYYKTGFNAVRLYAEDRFVRAWPGGTGAFKVGANYAPCIYPQSQAALHGCQQDLWLFGPRHEITEVGTMNCFIYWINERGEKELITPPLSSGMILPGVTRDSILSLAKSWKEFKVTEGTIFMEDLTLALNEGRVLEMFGSGTAAIISPIKEILYQGKTLTIPLDPKNKNAQAGPLATKLWNTIVSIQYGEIAHEWSVPIN